MMVSPESFIEECKNEAYLERLSLSNIVNLPLLVHQNI
jgi:hypothetical protein